MGKGKKTNQKHNGDNPFKLRIQTLEEEVDLKDAKIKNLERQIESKDERIRTLDANNKGLASRIRETRHLERKIASLETTIEGLRNRQAENEVRNLQLKNKADQHDEVYSRFVASNDKLEAKDDEIRKLEDQNKTLEKIKKDLWKEVRSVKSELRSETESLGKKARDLVASEKRLEALKDQMSLLFVDYIVAKAGAIGVRESRKGLIDMSFKTIDALLKLLELTKQENGIEINKAFVECGWEGGVGQCIDQTIQFKNDVDATEFLYNCPFSEKEAMYGINTMDLPEKVRERTKWYMSKMPFSFLIGRPAVDDETTELHEIDSFVSKTR